MVSALAIGVGLLVVLGLLAVIVWYSQREVAPPSPAIPQPGDPGLPPLTAPPTTAPPGERPWYADYGDQIPGIPAAPSPDPTPSTLPPPPLSTPGWWTPAHEISGEVDPLLTAGALPGHFYYKTPDGAFREIADCYNACLADPDCVTFTYDENARSCRLSDRYGDARITGALPNRTYAGALQTPTPMVFSRQVLRSGESPLGVNVSGGAIDPKYQIATHGRDHAPTNEDCFKLCQGNLDCVTFAYNGDQKNDRCRLYNGGFDTIDRKFGKNYRTYPIRVRA